MPRARSSSLRTRSTEVVHVERHGASTSLLPKPARDALQVLSVRRLRLSVQRAGRRGNRISCVKLGTCRSLVPRARLALLSTPGTPD